MSELYSVFILVIGYMFPTADSIRPFVEFPDKSPSREACVEIAQRLKCYVVAGYPAPTLPLEETKEQAVASEGQGAPQPAEPEASNKDTPKAQDAQESELATSAQKAVGVARNNAVVVDPNGAIIHEYTKVNMFESDLPWAQPGMSSIAQVVGPLTFVILR